MSRTKEEILKDFEANGYTIFENKHTYDFVSTENGTYEFFINKNDPVHLYINSVISVEKVSLINEFMLALENKTEKSLEEVFNEDPLKNGVLKVEKMG